MIPQSKKGPIAWMATNPVAANILMIILLFGGLFAATRVQEEFLPNAELDHVYVSVAYPGASPDEVEQGIILAIEEVVYGLNGVNKIVSFANENSGTVRVEVLEKSDVNRVADDVRNAVDRIRTFPLDAEEPTISIVNLKRPVLDLIISADVSLDTLRELTETVRDRLLQHPGITQLELENVRSREISVEISQQNSENLILPYKVLAL